MFALKVSLMRPVTNWPPIRQGEDSISVNLAGVNLSVWNDAFIAKQLINGGATVTADLQNYVDLLNQSAKVMTKVFALAVKMDLSDPTKPNAVLKIKPGAVNPLQWFFTSNAEGIKLPAGHISAIVAPIDYIGYTVDATHRTLDFTNTGTDPLNATIIVLGGA